MTFMTKFLTSSAEFHSPTAETFGVYMLLQLSIIEPQQTKGKQN